VAREKKRSKSASLPRRSAKRNDATRAAKNKGAASARLRDEGGTHQGDDSYLAGELPEHEARTSLPFPIVGVGASAGGLEAFTQLLQHLPRDTGMAFVLVQHLDPTHSSVLTELLQQTSPIPVQEVQSGVSIERGRVYVIPPNTSMTMVDGHLQLTPRTSGRLPMPVNDFFRSLAEHQGPRAVGVVLSGTANDGAAGLEAIKGAGGVTFAQTESTAKFSGMPRNAVSTGCVDFVLSPAAIARELTRIGGHRYMAPFEAEGDGEHRRDGTSVGQILSVLRKVAGVDFSQYKTPTLHRRIRRRMLLQRVDSLSDYLRTLQRDHKEVDALCQDLLIRVTSFFRDAETFETLKRTVFPELLRGRSGDAPIRVWVPGCATGEEAYSLAICLIEFLENVQDPPAIQLYATDVSESAILKARAGTFLESIAADVSPERLRRFFVREEEGYRISSAVRDRCVFAKHDLTRDAPFSHIDLISCRNVLIYLTQPLQKRVFTLFHYALRPTGILVLGGSESVGAFPELFTATDKKHRIYRRIAAPPGLLQLDMVTGRRVSPTVEPGRQGHAEIATLRDLQKEADRVVLSALAPVGVVVNDILEVVQFRGRTSPYLEPPTGTAHFSLLKMVRSELAAGLRTAIDEARSTGIAARSQGMRLLVEGQPTRIAIEVVPFKAVPSGDQFFIVLFTREAAEEARRRPTRPLATLRAKRPTSGRRVNELEQELAATKEYVQRIIEEQEATNEELRSSTEEIQASYEELQSSNEELETAKEELQSANEELTTVNEELHRRTFDLSEVNNDLANFLASVNIPVIRIGNDLRIRRFTPNADRVLNVIATDIGRLVSDITLKVDIPEFEQIIARVMDTLTATELEARDHDGRWWYVRIRPYHTADHRIDGVVIAFVEIEGLDEANRAAAEIRHRLNELERAAHELSEAVTPAAVGAVLATIGSEVLDAVASLVTLGGPRERWQPLYSSQVPAQSIEQLRSLEPRGVTPLSRALNSGEAVTLPSPQEIEQRFPEANPALTLIGAKAAIALPLRSEGQVLGGLVFYFRTPREFAETDLSAARTIARLGAQALGRTLSHSGERSLRDEVAALRSDRDAANRLAAELAARIAQLDDATRVSGASRPPRGKEATPSEPLSALPGAGLAPLLTLVTDLALGRHIGSKGNHEATAEELLEDVASRVRASMPGRHVTVSLPTATRRTPIAADARVVREALLGLLWGVIRLSDDDETHLDARREDGTVVFEVCSPALHGAGAGLIELLHQWGTSDTEARSGSPEPAARGDGSLDPTATLAFVIAKRLAVHLGGDVSVVDSRGRNSALTLSIPDRRQGGGASDAG